MPDTIVGTTETQTLTDKTLSTGSVIDANVNVVEVLKKVYPVGSIYINASDSTNPATLMGFGTWVAFGAGRVMVGLDAGDTSFDTAGETGGVKSVTLTSAQSGLPAHSHSIKGAVAAGSRAEGVSFGNDQTPDYTSTAPIQNNTAQNASESHTNLQPYIVVYFWKRTA